MKHLVVFQRQLTVELIYVLTTDFGTRFQLEGADLLVERLCPHTLAWLPQIRISDVQVMGEHLSKEAADIQAQELRELIRLHDS